MAKFELEFLGGGYGGGGGCAYCCWQNKFLFMEEI